MKPGGIPPRPVHHGSVVLKRPGKNGHRAGPIVQTVFSRHGNGDFFSAKQTEIFSIYLYRVHCHPSPLFFPGVREIKIKNDRVYLAAPGSVHPWHDRNTLMSLHRILIMN